MDSDHAVNPDLTAYFQSPSSAAVPALDSVCSLAEIPVPSLKTRQTTRKKEIGSRNTGVRNCRVAPQKGCRVAPQKGFRGAGQGTIQELLEERNPQNDENSPENDGNSPENNLCVDLTQDAFLKEFCGSGSQEEVFRDGPAPKNEITPGVRCDGSSLKDENSCVLASIEGAVDDRVDFDETPPLSPTHSDDPRSSNTPSLRPLEDPSVATERSLSTNYSMAMEITGLSDIHTPDISIGSDSDSERLEIDIEGHSVPLEEDLIPPRLVIGSKRRRSSSESSDTASQSQTEREMGEGDTGNITAV